MGKAFATSSHKKSVTLADVPVELLSQIAALLDAASLRSLSRSCKPLNQFVQLHGWRAFVLANFPHYTGRSHWPDAAHSLSRQADAWRCLALNAHTILPTQNPPLVLRSYIGSDEPNHDQPEQSVLQSEDQPSIHRQNGQAENCNTNACFDPAVWKNRRRGRGQTMGYQTVLDVVERWAGGGWTDRQEILAVGAGAEVLVRQHHVGMSEDLDLSKLSLKDGPNGASGTSGASGKRSPRWTSIKNPAHREGVDDVTILKVLNRDPATKPDESIELIVGRANGLLERLSIPSGHSDLSNPLKATSFETNASQVRLLDVAPADSNGSRQFAVSLGKKDIGLYDSSSSSAKTCISVDCGPRQTARIFTLRYLDPTLLAVGHGISDTPLEVFSIRTEEGISASPLRRFRLPRARTIYSIAPLPEFPSGTVFVTGAYDGSITVHDMRDRRDIVDTYTDPYEAGAPVYRVLPVQPHIVLAATAMHQKMLVFDLRRGANYSSSLLDAPPKSANFNGANPQPRRRISTARANSETAADSGISSTLFLSRPPPLHMLPSNSIYSLARASSASPSIYIGLEAGVVQMDVFRGDDPLPDPVFAPAATAIAKAWKASKRSPKGGSGGGGAQPTTTRQDRYRALLKSRVPWNDNVIDMRLMPHAGPASNGNLVPWTQSLLGERQVGSGEKGLLDARWMPRAN